MNYINNDGQLSVAEYVMKYDKFLTKASVIVKRKCPKLDLEDIKQQLILNLLQSNKYYDNTKSSNSTYYSQIIINAAYNLIKKYWQIKNKVYAESVSLDAFVNDIDESTYMLFVKEADDSYLNPQVYVKSKEIVKHIDDVLESCSSLEKKVFGLYMEGYNIEEIASKINKSKKTVYNILAIIREKIKKYEY